MTMPQVEPAAGVFYTHGVLESYLAVPLGPDARKPEP